MNADVFPPTYLLINLRCDVVGIAEDNEVFPRLPESQNLGVVVFFTGIEQGFVQRQILGGSRQREVEAFHSRGRSYGGDGNLERKK
jgi:hypothetical protein